MSRCESCPALSRTAGLRLERERDEKVVALVGNPNTGKSTLFNALTGLRQWTGNWPGTTVGLGQGSIRLGSRRYRFIDLPGTYSVFSPVSPEEKIVQDFLLQARLDCVVVVLDASVLERNLNLTLQVLELAGKVVLCVNLQDEAARKGVEVNVDQLAEELGVPAVATVAPKGRGVQELVNAVAGVVEGPAGLRRIPKITNQASCEGFAWNENDRSVESRYAEARRVARRVVRRRAGGHRDVERRIDQLVTSRILGLPLMLLILGVVFWITVVGANYPSELIASALFWFEGQAAGLFGSLGAPWWLTGFLWHGVYRGLAWVVSVMLPPMAIFFPLFTLLEDLGYLPRVAFNLDWLFRKAGAHGKQALTMAMGFGCNAAAVRAARIIDSPRERVIAILTNTFVPCNGRFPTLIMLASIFVAAAFPPVLASLIAAGAVVAVVIFGIAFTLVTSWLLSRTLLRGESSAFALELPPYRRPRFLRVLYTSFIDRTIFVLWRAVIMAAPAGGVIWTLANIPWGEHNLAYSLASLFNGLGAAVGLDGVILLAYLIAIPANEIVVPTILLIYTGAGALVEVPSFADLRWLLVEQQGWTLLTALNLMLFSLLHNPCATTIFTIWRETRSTKWTLMGVLLPLGSAFLVTFATTWAVRLLARHLL